MRLRFEYAGEDAREDLSSLSRFMGLAVTACGSDIGKRRSQLAVRGAVVRSERPTVSQAEDCSGMGRRW